MSKIVISEPYIMGEKPSPLIYQFLDANGVAINITGWTVKFNYQERDGVAVTGAGVTSVSDGPNGKAMYTFTGAEFTTAGHYRAEMIVGNGTNRYISVEINFTVAVPVGTVPSI